MNREAILGLRFIAAAAEKLASDLERGRLWESDYSKKVIELRQAINELPEDRGR